MTTLVCAQPKWPASRLCRLFDVARSSHYYQHLVRDETPLCESIRTVAGAWPRYGIRRITHELRRLDNAPPVPVGQRRVHRLMREMGLCAKARRPRKKRTTNSEHDFRRYPNLVKGMVITRPDQVWVSDITYIALGSGFVYLGVIMDVYSRCIRGWQLSRSLEGDLCLDALNRALTNGAPSIHHSDQGVQYANYSYTDRLRESGVQISMAAVGCPEDNGYAERLMRTIKEEHVTLTEYANFEDAKTQIGHFLEDVYQRKRIHSALDYRTPAEFETIAKQEIK